MKGERQKGGTSARRSHRDVLDLVKRMHLHGPDRSPVIDESRQVVGFVSPSDILRVRIRQASTHDEETPSEMFKEDATSSPRHLRMAPVTPPFRDRTATNPPTCRRIKDFGSGKQEAGHDHRRGRESRAGNREC